MLFRSGVKAVRVRGARAGTRDDVQRYHGGTERIDGETANVPIQATSSSLLTSMRPAISPSISATSNTTCGARNVSANYDDVIRGMSTCRDSFMSELCEVSS